jgi:hypothetical protein
MPLSDKKLTALAALHAARRGQRVQQPGLSAHQLALLIRRVAASVAEPQWGRVSKRVLATHCQVSEKTVRRWLEGTDWPSETSVERLQIWIAERRNEAARKKK